MSNLHLEVFDKKRFAVFNLLVGVTPKGLLAGGTAIALQIAHRRSYDFDVLLLETINETLLDLARSVFGEFKIRPSVDTKSELTLFLDEEIKLSFIHFPFKSLHPPVKTNSISLYSIHDLASNKAYAIGRRGEWKDYVDLYFLLREKELSIESIIKEAEIRFNGEFDEKLFWEQLVYWKDLTDFKIEYITKSVDKDEIQKYFADLVKKKFSKL